MTPDRFNRRTLATLALGAIAAMGLTLGCDSDDYDDDYYYNSSQTYPYDDPYERYDNGAMRPGGTGTSGRDGIDTSNDPYRDRVSPSGNPGGVGNDGGTGGNDPS